MWQDLVDQKEKWIGGTLKDFLSPSDRRIVKPELIGEETTIVDFKLTDEWFGVVGEDFECGGSREFVSINPSPQFDLPEGGLAFSGYGGHEWHITPKEVTEDGVGKV